MSDAIDTAADADAAPPPPDAFAPGLFDWLLAAAPAAIDALPYGVVTLSPDGQVLHYGATESRLSGLSQDRVLGRDFFGTVAPCMNNFLVAHRYATEPELDAVVDYVLTLRMAPCKVKLRLLRRAAAPRMYLVIERRV
ncbi:hypothetical protein [Falsiroseomonas ponticola]|uniref:hypothetical protein n=1 Tax=Falsiroseomonas ponticola TaxID=2786951 RepID=UPI0019349E82|nr:hypothetical protein [Roseomonas ponticola]